MLAKSTLFLEMYISYHFFRVVIAVTSVTSASSALLTSSMLKIEFTILDKHIYFCVFQ